MVHPGGGTTPLASSRSLSGSIMSRDPWLVVSVFSDVPAAVAGSTVNHMDGGSASSSGNSEAFFTSFAMKWAGAV